MIVRPSVAAWDRDVLGIDIERRLAMLTMPQPDREKFAAEIRDEIKDGTVSFYLSYEPGDGTHYDLLLVHMGVPLRLHAPVDVRRHMIDTDSWVLADADVGHRSMIVDLTDGHYTDASYVTEHWQRTTLASAVVIAELLNLISGYSGIDGFRVAWPQVFGAVAVRP